MTGLIQTIFIILQMRGTMLVNRFIYYFQRLPLIGKKLSDKAYDFRDIKLMVTIVSFLFNAGKTIFTKTLYVLLMVVLPIFIVSENTSPDLLGSLFVNSLVFLSLFYGSLGASKLLENNLDRYRCIKLMHMPTKKYVLGSFFMKHLEDLFGFLPVILISGTLLNLGLLRSFLFVLLIIACHIIGDALHLFILNKTKHYFGSSLILQALLVILSLALAYLPLMFINVAGLFLGKAFIMGTLALVFNPIFLLGILLLTAFSIYYIFSYEHYGVAMQIIINIDTLMKLSDPQKLKAASRFRDVTLKEKDLNLENKKINRKKGYDYLNALFFERHKRILLKPVLITIGIIFLVSIVYALLGVLAQEISAELSKLLIDKISIFVFLMYFLSIFGAERACRAMFGNCDISLLRYGFYREPKVILENFRIRLKMLAKLNFMIAGALCFCIILGVKLSGIYWPLMDEILFLLCILSLALFFSVHHLFLYYVFQPYTSDLEMKNPFFKIISGAIYFICYGCIYIRTSSQIFTYLVLGATLFYIVLALVLVYKFAPKNFRVK